MVSTIGFVDSTYQKFFTAHIKIPFYSSNLKTFKDSVKKSQKGRNGRKGTIDCCSLLYVHLKKEFQHSLNTVSGNRGAAAPWGAARIF